MGNTAANPRFARATLDAASREAIARKDFENRSAGKNQPLSRRSESCGECALPLPASALRLGVLARKKASSEKSVGASSLPVRSKTATQGDFWGFRGAKDGRFSDRQIRQLRRGLSAAVVEMSGSVLRSGSSKGIRPSRLCPRISPQEGEELMRGRRRRGSPPPAQKKAAARSTAPAFVTFGWVGRTMFRSSTSETSVKPRRNLLERCTPR